MTVSAAVETLPKLDICPACHPTYTGKKELKVVKGRRQKFLEKQKKIDQLKKAA